MPDQSLYGAHIAHRRDQIDTLLNAHGYDALLIHSGRLEYPRFDDRARPFRVHGHFNAWAPLPYADDCLLELRSGQRPVLWYYQPKDFWHLPPATPENWWAQEFDVRVVSEWREWLPLFEAPEALAAIGAEWALQGLGERVDLNPRELLTQLDETRTRKTPWECSCIESATQKAVRAHEAARHGFLSGGSELEIFYAYMHAINEDPHTLPYDAIVAINEHASTLHYQHRQSATPQHHYSFLLDAGADTLGYAADITRTHLGSSKHPHSGLFHGLIDAMDHLERRLALSAKPGQSFVDLHQQAHLGIAEILHQTQLVKGSTESMVEQGITRKFFPHGLGHFLGAQVHDVAGQISEEGQSLPPPPEDPMLRLTRTLEEGHVVTIEPGLYFIPLLLDQLRSSTMSEQVDWDLVESLIPFGGIRIEDNVLVAHEGPVNFTRRAFDDVE